MSSLMHKPTGPTLEGQTANLRRQATANPAFKPEFRRSVKMHPVLAGSVAAVVLLVLILFALNQKPMYYAESLTYIEPFNSKVLGDNGSIFDSTKYDSSIAQQTLTAQRSDILINALNTLPKAVWAGYGATPQAAAGALQGQLKIARVTSSYQLAIGLKGPNAANTAAIVNAVTTAYLEAGRKDEISQADQRSQLLAEERARIVEELASTRAEQTRLGTQLGIANPGTSNLNPYDSQLEALRQQLISARATHDQAAAQLDAISGVNGDHASGLTAAANDVINGDPGLGSMKSTINQRRAQLASQMADLKPANPIYKADQDELADLDKTLDSMTAQLRDRAARQLQDKLRTDLERSSDVEARLNSQLGRQTAAATSASPRLQRAADLNADVQRLTERYATVDNALHSLQLETSGPGMAHLALAATTPAAPEPSKRRLILLAALPLALFFGLTAAVFARKRDRHVYIGLDVDDVLGFAPIAILPARGEVSSDVLDEYYLRLAAGVEGAYRAGNARTFVITPVSSETDTAPLVQALDRKLVELGLGVTVLTAATVFEQQPQPATSNLTSFDPALDRHYEGLADTLFSRLKAEHDVILLEAPALLISAQTEYVARCSDVTLLVAASAVTTRGELYQAGVLLQRLNVTGVGSVLEELQLRNADSAFARGLRALERRGRPARREPIQAVRQPEPQPVAEPIGETCASAPISVEPAGPAWYPDHVVAAQEDLVAESPVFVPTPAVRSHEIEATLIAESIEPEHPAPVGLFDSTNPAKPGRNAASAPRELDEEPAPRSWFQRIFAREPEPVIKMVPEHYTADEEEELSTAVPTAFDASRYDLLPPKPTQPQDHLAAQPVAQAAFQSQPSLEVEAGRSTARTTVIARPTPVAQVVEEPLPEPVAAQPVASISTTLQPAAPLPTAAQPVASQVEATSSPANFQQPAASSPEPASAIYAFSAAAVAPPRAATPPAAEVAHIQAPRTVPARPLSFLELSQRNDSAASAPVPEAAPESVQPSIPVLKPVAQSQPEPIQHSIPASAPAQATEPEPAQYFEEPVDPKFVPTQQVLAAEPAAIPVADDWNPAPLNRWDPIPPLRQQEPWRISSGSIRAAQQQSPRDVWRGEDPVRIPPADRWVSAESLPADVLPAESTDVVLTRRWGLLSRFQQGESFRATHAPGRPEARQPEPDHYAQDSGQTFDPEYDRQRR